MSDEKKAPTNEELLERFFIMMKAKEEQMALATDRDEERVEAARRRTKYERNNFWQATQAYNRQERCKHLKGTSTNGTQLGSLLTEKNPIPWKFYDDFNVGMHTFITGETKIWCLCGCGWHVWNRPGWAYKFAVGLKMVKSSSNHPSMSEMPYKNGTDRTLTDGIRPYTVTTFDGPPSMLDPNENPIRGLAINRKKPE